MRWDTLATTVDTIVVLMGAQALPAIADRLVRHGRPPDTPVALIHRGTTAMQATVVASLRDVARSADATRVPAPVVAVIGEVVRLRDRLASLAEHYADAGSSPLLDHETLGS